MNFLGVIVAGCVLLAGSVAQAESGEELRARGEQLAKEGRYSEAIDSFKAAERLEPRARHSCFIALAYIRRELWPQAEIFLEQCEKRATPADPQPEWVPAAKAQLADRLKTVNVAPVQIKVEPVSTSVKLAVSSFAPDERFEPRTIHLPPGRHTITATAPGYTDETTTITVGADKAPVTTTIVMRPVTEPVAPRVNRPLPLPSTPRPSTPSKVPLVLIGSGAAVGVAGAIVHLALFLPAKNKLNDATTDAAYDAHEGDYDRWEKTSIALYAVGGAAVLTGVILKLTVFASPEAPTVAVTPMEGGGGMVSVGWIR